MEIKVINNSNNPLPAYETDGAAGMDLRAFIDETYTLFPGEYVTIPTGIHLEIPEGYEVQVRPRSGLASKYGITVLNSPGTIDSDYRGQIHVPLVNHSDIPFRIKSGNRIAQMVVAPIVRASLVEVQDLTPTNRDDGGFGSTGIK